MESNPKQSNITPCAVCYGAGKIHQTLKLSTLDTSPTGVWVSCECCGMSTPIMENVGQAISLWNWMNREQYKGKVSGGIIDETSINNIPRTTNVKNNVVTPPIKKIRKPRVSKPKLQMSFSAPIPEETILENQKYTRQKKHRKPRNQSPAAKPVIQKTEITVKRKRGRPVGWRKYKTPQ